jgi:coenzyme F420-reducing hydrogenase beta subunit
MILLKNKKDCCGCNACMQICHKQSIDMVEDEEGFLYPKVNMGTCNDCGLCEKVCPIINQAEIRRPLHVYASKNKNEEVRMQSSSGGIFTLLAEQIIQEGGVVFGARFDENWEVMHDYTETIEGLAVFRGSKYVQSKIGNTFRQAKEFLQKDRKVLFSGTPCQIAGLKLYLKKEYENLLTIDFVCHGVPSPKVWRTYLAQLVDNQVDMRGGELPPFPKEIVLAINFRDKTYGWEKFSLSFLFLMKTAANTISEIKFRDKRKSWKKYNFFLQCHANEVRLVEPLDKNVFMKGFLNDLYLRSSCYACPSKSLKSGSDITLGDYWGIQNVLPEFDDDKGVSLVMINTEKGSKVYEDLKKESIETTYANALAGNPSIEKSVHLRKKREEFMNRFATDKSSVIYIIKQLTRLTVANYMRIFTVKVLRSLGLLSIIRKLNKK